MNKDLESGLKEGWQVEEVDGKTMLAIYVKGERIQLHNLADFPKSFSDDLKNKTLGLKRDDMTFEDMKESFYSFLSITLHPNFSWSDAIMRNAIDSMVDERRTLIVNARQVGISTLLRAFAIWRAAFYGEYIYYLTNDHQNATHNADQAYKALSEAGLEDMVTSKNKVELRFGEGRIKFQSASPQAGRGEGFDSIIVDNFAYISEDTWINVSHRAAMTGGKTILGSAPEERNTNFYKFYMAGKLAKNNKKTYDIIGLQTIKDYKIKDRRVAVRFQIPTETNLNDVELFSCDDIYVAGKKHIEKFTSIKTSSRYRGKTVNGVTEALFVFEKPTGKTDLGFTENQDNYGYDFVIATPSEQPRSIFNVFEMPFYLFNREEMSTRFVSPKRKNDDPWGLQDIEDMFNDQFGEKGYLVHSDGRIEFDPDRLYRGIEETHVAANCFFKRRELKSKTKASTISMRMDGETMFRINDKIEELKILTKKDLTLSDYVRGLVKKDLN